MPFAHLWSWRPDPILARNYGKHRGTGAQSSQLLPCGRCLILRGSVARGFLGTKCQAKCQPSVGTLLGTLLSLSELVIQKALAIFCRVKCQKCQVPTNLQAAHLAD